jgi:hypothetical protein
MENRIKRIILFCFFIITELFLVCPESAQGLTMGQGFINVDLGTSPSIVIRAIGPDSPRYLRIWMEIINDNPSCTLKMTLPVEALHVWHDEGQNRLISTKQNRARAGTIWLAYDVDRSTTYPVRRLKATGLNPLDKSQYSGKGTDWTNEISIPPLKRCILFLDFEFPKNPYPRSCTLHIENLDLGCGGKISLKKKITRLGMEAIKRYIEDMKIDINDLQN